VRPIRRVGQAVLAVPASAIAPRASGSRNLPGDELDAPAARVASADAATR